MTSPFDRMRQEFIDKEYRHEYADSFLDSKIATQLKVLREQRGWTQQQLAQATGMQQARISVMEDVDYSSWSISTLRRYARAFDLRLDVEFKEFGTLPADLNKFNRESLQKRSFEDDPVFHESIAPSHEMQPTTVKVQNTNNMAKTPLQIHSRHENLELNFGPTTPNPNEIAPRVKIGDTTSKGEIRYQGGVRYEPRAAA